jgi:hypothetical protein
MIENWKDVLIEAAFGALVALICFAALVLFAPTCRADMEPVCNVPIAPDRFGCEDDTIFADGFDHLPFWTAEDGGE